MTNNLVVVRILLVLAKMFAADKATLDEITTLANHITTREDLKGIRAA